MLSFVHIIIPNNEPLSRLFLYVYYYLMNMLLSLCGELHIVYKKLMAVNSLL